MNFESLVRPAVLTQPTYEPGRPIEDVARDFGLDPEAIVKLASNENPLGPSPLGLAAAQAALENLHRYPDGGAGRLRGALAAHWGLEPGQFLIGNGSNEVMLLIAQALLGPGDEAVMGAHAFIAFKLAVLASGATPVEVPMPNLRHDLAAMRAAVTPRTKLLYLPNPNNPTGDLAEPAAVMELARSLPPEVVFLLDEAYAEYLDPADLPDLRELLAEGRAVIGCRTFSKIYGLAGLRVGYAYGPPELMALIARLRMPFNVNTPAQEGAIAALLDTDFVVEVRRVNEVGMEQVTDGLTRLGIAWVPSAGNFLLIETPDPRGWFSALQRRGVITRPVGGYGLPRHLRISIGTAAENAALLAALAELVLPKSVI